MTNTLLLIFLIVVVLNPILPEFFKLVDEEKQRPTFAGYCYLLVVAVGAVFAFREIQEADEARLTADKQFTETVTRIEQTVNAVREETERIKLNDVILYVVLECHPTVDEEKCDTPPDALSFIGNNEKSVQFVGQLPIVNTQNVVSRGLPTKTATYVGNLYFSSLSNRLFYLKEWIELETELRTSIPLSPSFKPRVAIIFVKGRQFLGSFSERVYYGKKRISYKFDFKETVVDEAADD